MNLPGRKTQWAFKDKDLKKVQVRKVKRAEEKEWRAAWESSCDSENCNYPDCDCEDVD